MNTLFTRDPLVAAAFVRDAQLAAFPTETVYGLGADARNECAVRRIFEAKERPPDNPLIIHLAAGVPLTEVAAEMPEAARLLHERFMPGPLTLIMPRRENITAMVSSGLPTVGVRVPNHPVAQSFLKACGTPVAAPSANRSGRPSPTTWQAVSSDLAGRIACILQGEDAQIGLESTVVDCTVNPPLILRPGAITLEAIHNVIPEVRIDDASNDAAKKSPGMRHRHYAPRARVVVVDSADSSGLAAESSRRAGYIGLQRPQAPEAFALIEICSSLEMYARRLFDFFRRCDEAGIDVIYCQKAPLAGLGRALMDRLGRASEV